MEKDMATHFCVLAWRIPWTQKLEDCSPSITKESDTTEHGTAAAISDRGKSAPTPRTPQRPLPQVAAAPVAWLCVLGPCWAIETPHDPDVLCPSGFRWWVLSQPHLNLILL